MRIIRGPAPRVAAQNLTNKAARKNTLPDKLEDDTGWLPWSEIGPSIVGLAGVYRKVGLVVYYQGLCTMSFPNSTGPGDVVNLDIAWLPPSFRPSKDQPFSTMTREATALVSGVLNTAGYLVLETVGIGPYGVGETFRLAGSYRVD